MTRPKTPPDLQLLAQAFTASIHSVVIADARQPDLPIIYVNPAFERLSGYPAAEILGRNCRFLQGQDPNVAPRQEIRQALTQGRSTTVLLRNFRRDGTPFDNELTLSPIRDAAGIVTHFVAFQTDVTAREATSALMTRLQGVTQGLAAARTQDQACDLILRDALGGLGGVGGAVLLVQGQGLNVIAQRGQTADSIWQDGHLDEPSPATDALRSDAALFFDHAGALVAAYPAFEDQTGGVAAVASAVLPMVEEGRSLGVIVLDFKEPHTFTPDEEYFLRTLAGQCALALDRAQLSGNLERQVQDRTAELEAFVRFTEVADGEIDVLALAARAVEVLSALFSGCTNGYYALEDGRWKLKVHTDDLEDQPDLLARLKAGLPLETPLFAQPIQTGQPVFVDGGDLEGEQFAHMEGDQSIGTYPLKVDGTIQAVFALGLRDTPHWSPHQRAVFRSVGRSLALALERTETARQLTAQRDLLQASNEELEAFTYSVSHDLRTPVRHIVSFGDLLRKSLSGPLDAKTERYFGIVRTAAENLNTLIDGMLDVSRASRQPLKAEQVELNRILKAVRQKVEVDLPERQIDWQIADLPAVWGDAALLRRVIVALVDNAVKYTRNRERAVIEVWAEDRGQHWAVRVKDNGVGFNPQYANKLFTMFQRLHRQEDFGGAAVSLANARRIVARHGGTMMAEGQSDVGATFGFTLPKAPA